MVLGFGRFPRSSALIERRRLEILQSSFSHCQNGSVHLPEHVSALILMLLVACNVGRLQVQRSISHDVVCSISGHSFQDYPAAWHLSL